MGQRTTLFYKPPRDSSIADHMNGVYYALLEGRFLFDFVHEDDLGGETLEIHGAGGRRTSWMDVVPVGAENLWTENPFEGTVKDGQLWGLGAADMKCAIAAFISALADFKTEAPMSLLITGDEEGEALHGTQRLLPLLAERGLIPDLCLIGEPTALNKIGDTLKIGRRGSVTGHLTCFGKQGHIAYPQNTDNPIPRLLACLQELYAHPFEGTDVFPARLALRQRPSMWEI